MRNIYLKKIFVFCIFLFSSGDSLSEQVPSTLEVFPDEPPIYRDELDHAKRLSLGGVTPSYRPTASMIRFLSDFGVRSLRLINVEWDNKLIKGNDIFEVQWSKKLERELFLCKEFNLIPHIVVGQVVPHGLEITGDGNERRGISDWDGYRKYISMFLHHVIVKWNFNKVALEVGNEMDNNKFNWVSEKPMKGRLDPAGYVGYYKLFKTINEVVQDYKEQYPNVDLLIGGPALTQNSMNYQENSPKNWLIRFASDIVKDDVKIDFFSMHFYGSAGSREEFKWRVKELNKRLKREEKNIPIWITEWGTSAFFQFENENFTPDAGAFSLDFITNAAKLGIDNSLFIAIARHTDIHKSGPALLNRDGSASYAFNAIELLNSLSGSQVKCRSSIINLSCIAVREGGVIKVLLWSSGWAFRRMGSRSSAGFFSKPILDIDVRTMQSDGSVTSFKSSLSGSNYKLLQYSLSN